MSETCGNAAFEFVVMKCTSANEDLGDSHYEVFNLSPVDKQIDVLKSSTLLLLPLLPPTENPPPGLWVGSVNDILSPCYKQNLWTVYYQQAPFILVLIPPLMMMMVLPSLLCSSLWNVVTLLLFISIFFDTIIE